MVMPLVNGEYNGIDAMAFEILQYNVFGRPYEVSKDGQAERLARIPASLRKLSEHIDIVTFAEADVKGERESMLTQFRDIGFQYATSILHDPDPFTSLLNGGVIVVSRWPILHEAQHIYRNACHYSDCLAAKGVKYARVLKTVGGTSKIFNVFATHMQMRKFVDDMRIPTHEPLLFAGDFNVDNHTFASEVAELIELLGAHSPTQVGDQQFTSDPRSNLLVGRDGAANSNKCSEKYMQSWGDVKDGVYYPNALTRSTCDLHQHLPHELLIFIQPDNMCFCSCCPLEWLDYVLYAKAPYQQPLDGSTLESRINHVDPFVVDWTAPKSNMKMQLVDLSDHYPVLGKFVFAVNHGPGKDDDPLTYHLDGCSTDADCHFRAFRCYCNGANCYYNGTHLDGSDLASTHPVNRNCLYQKTSFQCLCGPT
uniref:sphingomyelin phosphodiesterase n=1 Tax=Globisporangium ultimum (strain ATCC 200006 / CBS 805.95 / DAOM BR144) TaxID=431595 RepID=K3WW34_GLOUD